MKLLINRDTNKFYYNFDNKSMLGYIDEIDINNLYVRQVSTSRNSLAFEICDKTDYGAMSFKNYLKQTKIN